MPRAPGDAGERGALEALARAVPAAGAVHVVNNNAAALVLAATVLAAGREIVISRGEMIEIGDGFRLPALLESTGARIREVGTTNRTTAADYAAAIGRIPVSCSRCTRPTTGSRDSRPSPASPNWRGSACPWWATSAPACSPRIRCCLRARCRILAECRAGLVTASGDKLLGGPQAGLLLGRAELVRRLARHPLARALRVDKLTIAALEATLAGPPVPVAEALDAGQAALTRRAERISAALVCAGLDSRAVPSEAAVGGGGGPGVALPSAAVSLPPGLAPLLRAGEAVRRGTAPAVVGRVADGRLLLDLRGVPAADDESLTGAVIAAAR